MVDDMYHCDAFFAVGNVVDVTAIQQYAHHVEPPKSPRSHKGGHYVESYQYEFMIIVTNNNYCVDDGGFQST